ncbi:type II toxin-antitoxin system HicA family toxin [Nostoc sp. DSM 114161]|uniref:type II toxin-antitoxin system HicA family toxin n=1 Tax=Nostoc sp. DSM 114161 TaxID=3440143 RepID=UPI0040452CD0
MACLTAFSNSSWLSEISIWNGRLITKLLNAPIYKFDLVWRIFIQNWYQKGSHKQFRHEDGRGTTVPFHKGRDISPRLLRQIASDIGLTVEKMLE